MGNSQSYDVTKPGKSDFDDTVEFRSIGIKDTSTDAIPYPVGKPRARSATTRPSDSQYREIATNEKYPVYQTGVARLRESNRVVRSATTVTRPSDYEQKNASSLRRVDSNPVAMDAARRHEPQRHSQVSLESRENRPLRPAVPPRPESLRRKHHPFTREELFVIPTYLCSRCGAIEKASKLPILHCCKPEKKPIPISDLRSDPVKAHEVHHYDTVPDGETWIMRDGSRRRLSNRRPNNLLYSNEFEECEVPVEEVVDLVTEVEDVKNIEEKYPYESVLIMKPHNLLYTDVFEEFEVPVEEVIEPVSQANEQATIVDNDLPTETIVEKDLPTESVIHQYDTVADEEEVKEELLPIQSWFIIRPNNLLYSDVFEECEVPCEDIVDSKSQVESIEKAPSSVESMVTRLSQSAESVTKLVEDVRVCEPIESTEKVVEAPVLFTTTYSFVPREKLNAVELAVLYPRNYSDIPMTTTHQEIVFAPKYQNLMNVEKTDAEAPETEETSLPTGNQEVGHVVPQESPKVARQYFHLISTSEPMEETTQPIVCTNEKVSLEETVVEAEPSESNRKTSEDLSPPMEQKKKNGAPKTIFKSFPVIRPSKNHESDIPKDKHEEITTVVVHQELTPTRKSSVTSEPQQLIYKHAVPTPTSDDSTKSEPKKTKTISIPVIHPTRTYESKFFPEEKFTEEQQNHEDVQEDRIVPLKTQPRVVKKTLPVMNPYIAPDYKITFENSSEKRTPTESEHEADSEKHWVPPNSLETQPHQTRENFRGDYRYDWPPEEEFQSLRRVSDVKKIPLQIAPSTPPREKRPIYSERSVDRPVEILQESVDTRILSTSLAEKEPEELLVRNEELVKTPLVFESEPLQTNEVHTSVIVNNKQENEEAQEHVQSNEPTHSPVYYAATPAREREPEFQPRSPTRDQGTQHSIISQYSERSVNSREYSSVEVVDISDVIQDDDHSTVYSSTQRSSVRLLHREGSIGSVGSLKQPQFVPLHYEKPPPTISLEKAPRIKVF